MSSRSHTNDRFKRSRPQRRQRRSAQVPFGPCSDLARVKPVAWSALEPGVVLRASVEFVEGGRHKARPVVIVSVDRHQVSAYEISGSAARLRRPRNIELRWWAAAGLNRPSGVQPRLRRLDRIDLLEVMGALHPEDFEAVFGLDAEQGVA